MQLLPTIQYHPPGRYFMYVRQNHVGGGSKGSGRKLHNDSALRRYARM
jgi:hypothetical protein